MSTFTEAEAFSDPTDKQSPEELVLTWVGVLQEKKSLDEIRYLVYLFVYLESL